MNHALEPARSLVLEREDLLPIFFMLMTVQPFFFASS